MSDQPISSSGCLMVSNDSEFLFLKCFVHERLSPNTLFAHANVCAFWRGICLPSLAPVSVCRLLEVIAISPVKNDACVEGCLLFSVPNLIWRLERMQRLLPANMGDRLFDEDSSDQSVIRNQTIMPVKRPLKRINWGSVFRIASCMEADKGLCLKLWEKVTRLEMLWRFCIWMLIADAYGIFTTSFCAADTCWSYTLVH